MTLSVKSIGSAGYQTTIADDRMLTAALFAQETGLLTPSDFAMTPSAPGAGFALNVTAGALVIKGDDATNQGSYFVWNDVAEDIAWTPAVALPRKDSLLMVVADSGFGSPTVSDGPRWVVATGTAASSPVVLSDAEIEASWAQPGAWVRVGDFDVAAGQTSFVTNDIHQKLFAMQSRRMISMIREASDIWPANNTYITNTETMIGGGTTGQPTTKRLQKTITVKANRCYRIKVSSNLDTDGDIGTTLTAALGAPTAELRIRYASGASVTTAGTSIAASRAKVFADANTANPSILAEGYLNGLTPGTYTVGAFLIMSTTATHGARCFAPWQMTVEDVGPKVDETWT